MTHDSDQTLPNFQQLIGAITVFNSLVEKKIKLQKRATCRPAAAGKNNTEAQMIYFHVNTQIKGKVEWFVKNKSHLC